MDLNELDKYYTENLIDQPDTNTHDYGANPTDLLAEGNDITKARLEIYDRLSKQDPRVLLFAAAMLQAFALKCLNTQKFKLWTSAGLNNTSKIVMMQKMIRSFLAYKRATTLKLAQHWVKKQRGWYKEWKSMGRDQRTFSDRSLKTASNIWLWQATDPEVPMEFSTCVAVSVHLFHDTYTSFVLDHRAWQRDQDQKQMLEIGHPERKLGKAAPEPQYKKYIAPEQFFWASRTMVNRVQKILSIMKKAEEEKARLALEFNRQSFETQTSALLSSKASSSRLKPGAGGKKSKDVKSRVYDGIGTSEDAHAKREAVERRNHQISALTTTPWFEVDVDSDNKVDGQELMRLMQQRGIVCDKRDIEALMVKFDTSKDGMISKQERDKMAAALVQKQHGSGGQVILRGRPSPVMAKKQSRADLLIHEGSPTSSGRHTQKSTDLKRANSDVKRKGTPGQPTKGTKGGKQTSPLNVQQDPFQNEAVRRRRRYLKALSHCLWSDLDQNNDGTVTWGEIEDVLTELDGGVGPNDISDIIMMLDANKDGVVSKDEFKGIRAALKA